jgi:hypothetical protein
MCVIEGWAATSSIAALAQIPNVKRVDLPKYSRSHPPLLPHSGFTGPGAAVTSATNGAAVIDGNGVSIMRSDKYVQQTGKNGASITLAVISDDATNLAVIQGRGELPASINVVTPSANPLSHPTLTDEGTMWYYDADVYGEFGHGLEYRGDGDVGHYSARRLRTNCVGNGYGDGNRTPEEWRRRYGSMDAVGAWVPCPGARQRI